MTTPAVGSPEWTKQKIAEARARAVQGPAGHMLDTRHDTAPTTPKASGGRDWVQIGTIGAAALAVAVKLFMARSKAGAAPSTAAMYQSPGSPWKPLAAIGIGSLGAAGFAGVAAWKGWKPPNVAAPTAAAPRTAPPESTLDFLRRNLALDRPSPSATASTEVLRPTCTPPVDVRWLRLAPHPSVTVILGKRGSGKSALGYRLLELFCNQAAPYVVGLPPAARKLLPDWIGCVDRLEDVPPKAVVLLDESYIQYHARDSMSDEGRTIGQLVNLSRQKQQTLIFIVQEARQLDVNAISQADVIAVKELSEISREFERSQLRRFIDKARIAFAGVKGNRQRHTWIYSETAGEVGLVENELPSFWKPSLSRAFALPASDQATNVEAPRKGVRTPREELINNVGALSMAGHGTREIGRIMGLPPSTVNDYLKEFRSRHSSP